VGVLVIYVLYSEVFLNLTEVFSCFFLSCKANARVKLAKTEYGSHSSTLVVICVVRLLFLLLHVLFVCKCVLPPGDNPIVVDAGSALVQVSRSVLPSGYWRLHTAVQPSETGDERSPVSSTDVKNLCSL
jgi:hypothetical protein